jgi:GntR family transcriptional regulator/MocR family aminotransferase
MAPAPFLRAAAQRGLRFQAISDFCRRKDLPPGLVIGYTAMDDAALRRNVDELRRLIQSA